MPRPFTVSIVSEGQREALAKRDRQLRINCERREFINAFYANTDRQDGTEQERVDAAHAAAKNMTFTGDVKYPG